MDAKTIIEPWMNGDPCEGCEDCAKLCKKLQARIDAALASRDKKIERLCEALRAIVTISDCHESARQIAGAALGRDK